MEDETKIEFGVTDFSEIEKLPKISVIIPVYKVEKYLPECIESVLAQTFTDFELILVDDGSPDNSGKICDDYAKKDSRIRVFHKENGGVTSARRFGVEKARGEWVMFVDGDDKVLPNALYCLLDEKKYPKGVLLDDVDLVEGGCCGKLSMPHQTLPLSFDGLEYAKKVANHSQLHIPGPFAKIIRKSVLISANALDVPRWINYGEDLFMNLKASFKIRKTIKIFTPVYYYRYNPQSVSSCNIRSISYFCSYLKEVEKILPQGRNGKMRAVWIALACCYFVEMFYRNTQWNAPCVDSYIRNMLRELHKDRRSLPIKVRFFLMITSINAIEIQQKIQRVALGVIYIIRFFLRCARCRNS